MIGRRDVIGSAAISGLLASGSPAFAQAENDSDIELRVRVSEFVAAFNRNDLEPNAEQLFSERAHGSVSYGKALNNRREVLGYFDTLHRTYDTMIQKEQPVVITPYLACSRCDMQLSRRGEGGVTATLRPRAWLFVFSFEGANWNKKIRSLHVLERV